MTDDAPPSGLSERRQRGLAKMSEVYSFDVNDGPGDFFGITVEHLFGDVWTRPALDVASRRLLTIGAIVGVGRLEVLEIQFQSALDNGELTPEQIREVVIHLTHYTGWPSGAAVFNISEQVIGRWEKAQAAAGRAEPPA
ncbi:MAG TPA: carboxymuconolactone decarboxylase family protein [Acidimicrobiales bacterium]